MKNFDFSGFKKVAEDAKSVTMQHDKGHKMVIAVMAIPKLQREQLKMLPLAKGGKVKGYAEGETIAKDPKEEMGIEQPTETAPQAPPVVVNNITPQPQAQAVPVAEPPAQNPAVAYANKPIATEQPQVPAAVPNLNPNGTMNPAAIAKNTQSAAEGQKNIDIAKGKALADVNQGYTQGLAENEQRRQKYYDDLNKHVDDFSHYIADPATKINPNAYWENRSTGQKVSMALGVALGGFGTAFGGTNYAQDFLNKQIDRDIDAQKKRADQHQTLLGAYERLYGEGNAAVNATKATMLDIYNQEAKQVALQLNTPQAMQNYLQYSAQNALEKSKLLQDASVDLNNLPGTNSGQAKGGAKEQTKPQASSDHILVPDSEKQFLAMQYDPQNKKNYEQIKAQKAGAALSDAAIDRINEVFPELEKNANKSEGINYVRQNAEGFGSIPFGVGSAISHGAKGVTDTLATSEGRESMRAYDRDRASMAGAIRAALKGQVSDALLDETIESYLPTWGDTPQAVESKRKAAIKFVKDHTTKDLLGKLKTGE